MEQSLNMKHSLNLNMKHSLNLNMKLIWQQVTYELLLEGFFILS